MLLFVKILYSHIAVTIDTMEIKIIVLYLIPPSNINTAIFNKVVLNE